MFWTMDSQPVRLEDHRGKMLPRAEDLRGGAALPGLVFIVNPQAGSGKTKRDWVKFCKIIKRLGYAEELKVRYTAKSGDARVIARSALQGGAVGVVAVGGDGTLHQVVQGFFQNGVNMFPSAFLGFVPSGTGCDFRRGLGWGMDLEESAKRLLDPKTTVLDVGMCHLHTAASAAVANNAPRPHAYIAESEAPSAIYFINVSSVGSSAEIAKIANEGSKMLGAFLTFYQASIRGLLSYKPRKARFRIDGGEWQEVKDVNSIAVCNGRFFGGGMQVSPTADPKDGLLDVTIWAGYNVLDFALLSGQIYSGKHIEQPKTQCLKCRAIEIEGDPPFNCEIDGEQYAGKVVKSWSILPRGVPFMT